MVNISGSPYYDKYTTVEKDKGYTHLLAVPGRVAQAREITQIQSLLKDIVKGIGDSIMKDGDILEGCQVTIRDIREIEIDPVTGESREVIKGKLATVSKGKVYINGIVIPLLEDTDVEITGVGEEIIGFKLVEELITEYEDNTLRDPAVGYANSLQPGCHRIKSTLEIVKLNPGEGAEGIAVLVTLRDGAVAVENYAGNYSELEQTLARRTHDESGSYIVEGLKVRVEDHQTDENTMNVVVESGKAYVLGYELKIPAPRRIPVSRALDEELVSRYARTYRAGENVYQIYSLPYVKEITQVEGTVQPPAVSMTIPYTTQQVEFPGTVYEDDIKLVSVKGSDGTDYTSQCDCRSDGGETPWRLVWIGTALRENLTVVVTYTRHHIFDEKDYKLAQDASGGATVEWVGGDDTSDNYDAPVVGTDFYVTYRRYLARKDVVYIDQYGEISVALGESASYGYEIVPEAPVDTLALATIMCPPNSSSNSVVTSNIGLTRFTMNDIQRLLNRIRTVEYDQAVLSLNTEAKQYDTPDKKGIFTDPLIDLSKIDYTYNRDGNALVNSSYPSHDVTIDFLYQMCYLPTVSHTVDLTVDAASTARRIGRAATLPVSGDPVVVLSQLKATESFPINPYSVFPQLPEISISPATDTWISDTIIEVPRSQTSNEVVRSSTRHVEVTNTQGSRRESTSTSTESLTAIGNRVSTSTTESVIDEMAVKYIRSREIEVTGTHFKPALTNIRCTFDGVDVTNSLVNLNTGAVGPLMADGDGKFRAKFTIPENRILTGIREIRFYSNESEESGYKNSAFALYQASGTARTIQRTVTTLTTILLERETTVTTTNYIDPVGQTFVLDRMTIVQGIDLYFSAKAENGGAPVTCEIREVLNGSITSTVYGHKTLEASEVKISQDSSVATRFEFDDPVLLQPLKEYAFVVRSTSSRYHIWVAELGKPEISTGGTVLSNPYLVGVMMSSSNNSSWNVHQNRDIKFRLLENMYQDTAEILFDTISDEEEFSRLYLLAESVIPDGASILWYYSTSESGGAYTPISPYSILNLGSMREDLKIKAVLKRDNRSPHLSPIVLLDSVGAVLSYYDAAEPRYYISNFIRDVDPYTHIEVLLDTYESATPPIEVYMNTPTNSNTLGGELVPLVEDKSKSRSMSYEWTERVYSADIASATTCRIFICLKSSNNHSTPAFRRLRVILS